MILMLLGKSASGKTTMKNMIDESDLFVKNIISTTTRPKRVGEIDGYDYYFVSEEQFSQKLKKNELVEYTKYSNWYYGIEKKELLTTDAGLVVTDVEGFRNFKRANIDFVSIYIIVPDDIRYMRQLKRGDNIVEIALRSERDSACFQNIELDVDFIVSNKSEDPNVCFEEIYSILKDILNTQNK